MAKKRDRADSGSSQQPTSKRRQQEYDGSSSSDDPDQGTHTYNLRKSQKEGDRRPGKKAGLEKRTMKDIQTATASKKAGKMSKAMKKQAQEEKYQEEAARVAALLKQREAEIDAEDLLMDQDHSQSDESDFQPDTFTYERSKKMRPVHSTTSDDDDKTWVDDGGEASVDGDDEDEGDDGGADVENDVDMDHQKGIPAPKVRKLYNSYCLWQRLTCTCPHSSP